MSSFSENVGDAVFKKRTTFVLTCSVRLAYIETTSWDSFKHAQKKHCFDHDSRNSPSNVNTFHSETCFIRDQTKHVFALV